jgi:hypothetical protein
MPVVIFFACLDLERKSSLINRLIITLIHGLEIILDPGEMDVFLEKSWTP